MLAGEAGAVAVAAHPDVDFVLAAISGGAGLRSTAAAIEAGKPVGLANKESLVLAGELLTARAAASGRRRSCRSTPSTAPSTSRSPATTAARCAGSSSPRRAARSAACPPPSSPTSRRARALKHPNWSMGDKITIDSATLMNKGLEVIEARWLFGVEPRRIDIVVHPESIVHSMVEYIDGSMVAQLGVSDMRGPISYALGHPERLPLDLPPLDLAAPRAAHLRAARPGALPGVHARVPRARARRHGARRCCPAPTRARSRRSSRGGAGSPTSPSSARRRSTRTPSEPRPLGRAGARRERMGPARGGEARRALGGRSADGPSPREARRPLTSARLRRGARGAWH